MVTKSVTIEDKAGLHARPCLAIIKALENFESKVVIRYGNEETDAREILQLMCLNAPCGAVLELAADGNDAEAALEAVEGAINIEW